MDDLKFSILDQTDVKYSNNLENYGSTRANITDFAILLGGDCAHSFSLNRTTGSWWTSSYVHNFANDGYKIIFCDGSCSTFGVTVDNYRIGCRPTIPYSSIKLSCSIAIKKGHKLLKVDFGEYPQYVASNEISEKLEVLFLNKNLKQTGKTYRIPQKKNRYKLMKIKEYEYQGSKYIRFIADRNVGGILSNDSLIEYGNSYWIKVKPITFLVDELYDEALTKEIVFAGVPFYKDAKDNYKNKDIEETHMYGYLNNIFSKDIIPSEYQQKKINLKKYLFMIKNNLINCEPPKFEDKKSYTESINIDEEKEVLVKIKGKNKRIIEVLKKLQEEEFDVDLINKKELVRSRGHYGYRK